MKTKKRLISIVVTVLIVITAIPSLYLAGIDLFPKTSAISSTIYNVGDLIQYGTYPQTNVTATVELSNAADSATWKSYNYYSGTGDRSDGQMKPSDCMLFADFFLDGIKYRAVKISSYRPMCTGFVSSADYSVQGDNGYVENDIYYFKYEPLQWRVLDPNTGFIMCESIIDSQPYQNAVKKTINNYFLPIGSTYACDYVKSSIREWLNRDFYETAFSAAQMDNIQVSTLNNDAYSGTYDSKSTNDKIFLLSRSEVLNTSFGFSSSPSMNDYAKQAQATDYSKCQGLLTNEGNYNWWLRSPGNSGWTACTVNYNNGVDYNTIVNYSLIGVRPACNLFSLNCDSTQSDYLFSQFEKYDKVKYETGDLIEFGTYPQTQVDETAALKNEKKTWKVLEYYVETDTGILAISSSFSQNIKYSGYMAFSDFFCNGEKYRAVKFTHYRPTSKALFQDYYYQEENRFYKNKVYYFKYEPLLWRVLDPDTGFIMCDKIIDSQAYHNLVYRDSNDGEYYQYGDLKKYANNYATSSIREWLNQDFYETAFTDLQKGNIEITTLDNSSYSMDYAKFNSSETEDRLFLLSYFDVTNTQYGFLESAYSNSALRAANWTDYSSNQGLLDGQFVNCWWLRTPDGNSSSAMTCDTPNGSAKLPCAVYQACRGVRPACHLRTLKSNPLQSESLYSLKTHFHLFNIETIIEQTCVTDGSQTLTCILCDETRTETLDATGKHIDNNNDGHCDYCSKQMTGGNHCKYCGKIHDGAFGWLVKFFHSIMAIFKR